MNPVTSIRTTWYDLPQEDDIAIPFLYCNSIVLNALAQRFQLRHLVIVGGEECPGTEVLAVVYVFCDRPGNAQAVIGAGATADLIQQNQTSAGCAVENMGALGHFDHKRTLPCGEIIGCADAGKNPVHQSDMGLARGDETADLGQEDDERDLAEVSALASHVGSGEDDEPVGLSVEECVVRDECQIRAQLLNDGMPPFSNQKHTRFIEG